MKCGVDALGLTLAPKMRVASMCFSEHTHTKPKLINRVGSANEEEELKQRIKGTNKHVGVISYGGYELTHLERS